MRISDWSSDVCSSDLLASPGACPSIGSSPCSSDEPPAKRAPPTDASALRSAVGPLSARMYQPSAASGRLAVHLLRPVSEPILERRINHGEEPRSEEHTSELQSLMRISYAVFCLKKKKKH